MTMSERVGVLIAILAGLCLPRSAPAEERAAYQLAVFTAEVTPPLGHALMGGGIQPAKQIDDPLFANGFVLLGAGDPIVFVAVDWCEIRNDAYDRWRTVLAEAAKTKRERVLVAALHQHDTPIADLQAQKLLNEAKAKGSICDLEFHEKAVQAVARALREGLKSPRRITHFGTGQAKVEKVASNRRYLTDDGKPAFGRTSATRDPKVREKPEGTVDPVLRTFSFWDGEQAVLALSCYATHPMSYYGKGGVSADFVGLARKRRQADDPKVKQLYVSGCSGNVTAGKYNDGNPDNRPVLADRIYQAMRAAWKATERQPLEKIDFRVTPLKLAPRDDPAFTPKALQERINKDARPFGQCLGALGQSWRRRCDAGQPIDLPVLDLGKALLVLLPGESYVEYQLTAQKLRPDAFVVTVGYGESGTGYIPTRKAVEEHDGNLTDWCWVAPGAEERMTEALKKALQAK
jgi:hypothetical protein